MLPEAVLPSQVGVLELEANSSMCKNFLLAPDSAEPYPHKPEVMITSIKGSIAALFWSVILPPGCYEESQGPLFFFGGLGWMSPKIA